jgi:hypothetical protein
VPKLATGQGSLGSRSARDFHQIGRFAHYTQGGAAQGHAQGLPPRKAATHWLHRYVDQGLVSITDKAARGTGNGAGGYVEALGWQIVYHLLVALAQLNAGLDGWRGSWVLAVGKACCGKQGNQDYRAGNKASREHA